LFLNALIKSALILSLIVIVFKFSHCKYKKNPPSLQVED
jgi:hypothetical protein